MTYSVQPTDTAADTPFDIEKLRTALLAYQPAPRNPKKEAFLALYPIIRQRIDDGLTIKQLQRLLAENDLSISHATVMRYLKEARDRSTELLPPISAIKQALSAAAQR